MKIRLTFKTPDVAEETINEAVRSHMLDYAGPADSRDDTESALAEELNEFVAKWVKYGEQVTIAFDTETCSATVLLAGG